MKKNMMVIALISPLLLAGAAYAQHDHAGHDGHAGRKHPAASEKKPAAAKKAAPAYRKVTEKETGKSAVCPVTGEKVAVSKDTVSMAYKGRNYYFCCPGCDKSFMKDPGKYAVEEKAAAKKYACPMGCVESDKPGRCPKCGMDMTEKKQRTAPGKKR